MILFDQESRILSDALVARLKESEKPAEVDSHLVEFDDVRYHVQAGAATSHITISIGLPVAPPGAAVAGGLGGSIVPLGALEAVEAAYGSYAKVLDEPEKGFDLTLEVDVSKVPTGEGEQQKIIRSLASLRSTIMAAPLRNILKALSSEGGDPQSPPSAAAKPTALSYRPKEAFYVTRDAEKATVVFPMNFQDSNDVIIASSFLQEFMEARRTASAQTAPFCSYSKSPPLELKNVPPAALKANAGYVSFVIFPRHVQGDKLGRTAWALLTFYAYVSYHIKCSKAFMHTRMRRRVEGLIQVLHKAKPETVKEKKTASGRTFVKPT